MNNAQIFNLLHAYVIFATGLPGKDIRITRPNLGVATQRDRGTIVTIGLINSIPIGVDSTFFKDIDGDNLNVKEVVSADENITASIKVYGEDAADVAKKIARNVTRSGAKEIFYNLGESIGFLNKGEILTLSEVLSGSYNEIRQLDMQFYINSFEGLTINAINSATIDTEVYTESLKLTGTIEVKQ